MAIDHIAKGDARSREKMNDTIDQANLVPTKASIVDMRALPTRLPHRPGEAREAFTRSTAGGPAENLPIFESAPVLGPRGFVFQAVGADQIVQRAYTAVEPGRNYLIRAAYSRAANAADPANDAIRVALLWYDQARNPLGGTPYTVLIDDVGLTTGSGLKTVSKVFAKASGDTVDIVAPAGAVYTRATIVTFGGNQRTNLEILAIVDVTDATLYAPDVSALESRVTAQETIDAGSRLNVVEAALNTPNAVSFATLLDAKAATVPASADTVLLRGVAAIGIGESAWKRAAGMPSHPVRWQDQAAAWFEPADATKSSPELAGALGDGAADDHQALAAAVEYAEAMGCRLELTREYFTTTAVDYRDVVLDPKPGAKLTGNVDLGKISRTLANMDVQVDDSGITFDTYISSRGTQPATEKPAWTTGGTAYRASRRTTAVDGSALITQQLAYPGGDNWTDTVRTAGTSPGAGEAAYTSEQVKWNITSGGIWYAGFVPIHGGQCLQGHFGVSGDYVRAAFVRNTAGYHAIYGNATGQLTLAEKKFGVPITSRLLPAYVGLSTIAAQQPGVTDWQIETESHREFRVKLSGQDVTGRVDIGTTAEIEMAGFGALASAAAVQPVVDYWSLIDTIEATGRAPLKAMLDGDSQAYVRNGSIEKLIWRFLDGVNGIRVVDIINRAVPGSNTLTAYEQVRDHGLSGAQIGICVAGVNEKQQSSPIEGSKSAIGAYCDAVKLAGGQPFVVLPLRYYSASEGLADGVPTTNSDSQTGYERAIANTASDRGAIVVDPNEVLGPIVPGISSGAFIVVEDNIHLTPYGKMLLAKAIADAVLAWYCRPLTASIPEKLLPDRFANGWSNTIQAPTYSVFSDGASRRIHLGGIIDAGTTTDGTAIYTLPRNLRPKSVKRFFVQTGIGTATLQIDTAGTIGVYAFTGSGYVVLDGISFEIAA